jgi:CheY-like chemotaxis protein
MPLILAVEPDPRQASRLSVVLRGRRNTDVVMAKSADTAIASMEGRIPDVLLTSQLLSPQDEQRLAEWLKELGQAAQHVQALTIPILAIPGPVPEPQRGLLAGLRRKTETGPSGCEPKVFADHVATYLEQGQVERVEDVMPQAPAVVAEEPAVIAQEPAAMPAVLAAPETPVTPEVEVPTVVIASAADPAPAIEAGAWLLTQNIDLTPAIDEAAQAADTSPNIPNSPMYELPEEVVPLQPMEVVFLPPEVITVWDEGWTPSRYVDRHESDTMRIPRAVRTDVPAPPPAAFAEPSTAHMAVVQASTAPPVMDEWGLFDPAKCGFSALLDKLDEITEEEQRAQANVDTSVRVVTHY